MVGCSAYGCKNRSEQNFLMKVFPRDPIRRKEWAAKVKREHWTPTNKSYICEVHFEPDNWEKTRVDGTRKLKCNAVPTIFSFSKPKQKRKPPVMRNTPSPKRRRHASDQPGPSTIEDMQPSSSEDEFVSDVSLITLQPQIVNEKLKKYEMMYNKALLCVKKYKNEAIKMKRKVNTMVQQNRDYIESLENQKVMKTVFNQDQIDALRSSTRLKKWTNATVTKAFRLRFACGTTGYEELIKQRMPLPSMRTLRRRLENIHFQPGILHEVFEFLSIKVGNFKNIHEKDCVITIDEMAITPSKVYDPALKLYLGDVNLPGHSSKVAANHALVIMLGGITSRWKQTVSYFFTGSSVDGRVYKDILYEIIKKTEDLGLNVVSITSDMGASNQAFWKVCGVTAGRHEKIKNYIQHPINDKKKNLYSCRRATSF